MPQLGYYPPQVKRQYEAGEEDGIEEEDDGMDLSGTNKQQQAADIISKEWLKNDWANERDHPRYTELAELNYHDVGRSTIQDSWRHYFGPVDDERTFVEIVKWVKAELSESMTFRVAYNEYYKAKGGDKYIEGNSRLTSWKPEVEVGEDENETEVEAEPSVEQRMGVSEDYRVGFKDGWHEGRQSVSD